VPRGRDVLGSGHCLDSFAPSTCLSLKCFYSHTLRYNHPFVPFRLSAPSGPLDDAEEESEAELAKENNADTAVQKHAALERSQVRELYNNCLKLASENKISQKNTWSLNLIDHISDLVRAAAEPGQTDPWLHAVLNTRACT
jgi:Condensin complex subunit 2